MSDPLWKAFSDHASTCGTCRYDVRYCLKATEVLASFDGTDIDGYAEAWIAAHPVPGRDVVRGLGIRKRLLVEVNAAKRHHGLPQLAIRQSIRGRRWGTLGRRTIRGGR